MKNIIFVSLTLIAVTWHRTSSREIFQIFMAQNSQKQGSQFVDLVYKFKQNYSQSLDFRPVTDQLYNSIYDSMVTLCTKMEPPDKRIRAIVADVGPHTLNGILMVSAYLHIPVIDIRRHFYANDPVLTKYYLSIYPSITGADKMLSSLFTRYGLYSVSLIVDAKNSNSFIFHQKLEKTLEQSQIQISHVSHFSRSISPAEVSNLLDCLNSYNVHAVLLFMDPDLIVDFFRLLSIEKIDVTQYVWIVSELGYSEDPLVLASYPAGTLAYKAIQASDPSDVLGDVTLNLVQTANDLAFLERTPPSLMDTINSITCLRNISGHHYHLQQGTKLYQHLKEKGLKVTMNGVLHSLDYGSDGFVSNAPFLLLNLIEGEGNRKEWKTQGKFVKENLYLNAIIWPGGSPRLPHSMRSVDTHKIRVVLKESLPFVMVTEQFSKTVADEAKCMDVGLICLNVTTKDPEKIQKILSGQEFAKRVCCFGFTIDLIKQISNDLSLSYVAYLTPEQMVGSKLNGTWRGMVGDIARGSADMAAGATSITPERMEVVDFTVPYYSSAFGTLSARKNPEPKLGAFLDPFSVSMWVLIFIFVHITAIFIAMFEWLSPYGLHPLGRNRAKTFSFPSGLLHTWSVLFSHTYNSKPPKSVASRIIVNAWGMFAVVFIAGYTANLASFMAGRMLDPNIDISQFVELRYPDRKLRFATIIGTSTEYYLKLYFPQKYNEFKKYSVLSLDEGVKKLKDYEIEALMFDAPMVDYKAATDPECTLIAAGSNFWSDTYGLAFSHGSSLTAKISSLIVKYEATGILTSWEKKWLNNKSECHSAFMSSYRLSFKHAGGVFVLIGIGVVAALSVLVFEWIIYKFLVPVLRKHKRHGRWRYIMFISQRLNSALQNPNPPRRLQRSLEKLSLGDLVPGNHCNSNNSLNTTTGVSKTNILSVKPNENSNIPSIFYQKPNLKSPNCISVPANEMTASNSPTTPPLLTENDVNYYSASINRNINRIATPQSDNYQPIVPIVPNHRHLTPATGGNSGVNPNKLTVEEQSLLSPLRVSPVHTVMDDMKFTNYTCKPNPNLKGSQSSMIQKPFLSSSSLLGQSNASPDSQHSPESQNIPAATSRLVPSTPVPNQKQPPTANGSVRTGTTAGGTPGNQRKKQHQLPPPGDIPKRHAFPARTLKPNQADLGSKVIIASSGLPANPTAHLRSQLSDEDSSRGEASSSGAEINL